MVDGHYSIGLPFKTDDVIVPNNELQARQRLKGLKSKMERNERFKDDYVRFIDNILDKGYAELVPPEEIYKDTGKTWYIPHHGVYHQHKPGNIRVVFDCTVLLQGPDLTNSLMSVLLRFRQETIAIMGDIEAMFFQIRVPQADCDYFRFLWWPGGDTSKQPVHYRMVVHLFGATSSPSCANAALHRSIEDNKGLFSAEISDLMVKSFYVDDCLVSVNSKEKRIEFIESSTSICQRGGFKLTKWVSNDRKVLESISEKDKAKEFQCLPLDCDSLPNERALGFQWSVERYTIGFSVNAKNHTLTRRGILSAVSSVYDPFGLVSPFVLTAKLILQDVCRLKITWDEEVTGQNLKKWKQWMVDLPLLERVEVNRCYKPPGFGEITGCQLHVFSDASDCGYGVVVYLRLTDTSLHQHCSLVMGKSRVAPLKKVSIPRMELTAATMAVRLSRIIVRELDYQIDKIQFWTDSTSVLRYIANESTRFHTFVANRLTVIHDGSDVDQWRFIGTKLNPADCASRGLSMSQFLENRDWLNGPEFLWTPESEWPVNEFDFSGKNLHSDDPEVKATINSTQTVIENSVCSDLIQRHSSWLKLICVLGWVLLAVEKFQKRTGHDMKNKGTNSKDLKEKMKLVHLPFEYVQRAECHLIKHVQDEHYRTEMDALTSEVRICTGNVSNQVVYGSSIHL